MSSVWDADHVSTIEQTLATSPLTAEERAAAVARYRQIAEATADRAPTRPHQVVGVYDGYDVIALRLPNRPAVDLSPLTVGVAIRALRLLDAGDWQGAYRLVLTASRPRGWRGRRRSRFLFRLRGDELREVLMRLLYPETMPGRARPSHREEKTPSMTGTLDDMLADYAARYGGPPRAEEPWPIVLALAQRASRHEARGLYHAIAGARLGSGVPQKGHEGDVRRTIDLIRQEAYG